MSKRKPGPKPILTHHPERVKIFLEGIQLGQTVRDAAEFSNISTSIIYEWTARGEEDFDKGKKTIYSEFLEQYNRAKQQFIRNALFQIYQAGKKDWRAAAYLLKMRHPRDYSDRRDITDDSDEVPETTTFAEKFMEALDEKTGR